MVQAASAFKRPGSTLPTLDLSAPPRNSADDARGLIWTLLPTCAVAAGILPAVEPGNLPGGIAAPQV
jgi:hypothetical protein